MQIPTPVLRGIARATGLRDPQLLRSTPVGGGCVSGAAALHTTDGPFFVKWQDGAAPGFFQAEADGLAALAATGTVRTPGIAAQCADGDPVPWILMEWIEPGDPTGASWRRLGRHLAALHRTQTAGLSPAYGWPCDNLVGPLPQPNGGIASWSSFWAERRIRPLARELLAARAISAGQAAPILRLADRTDPLLGPAAEADGPSLLHGDLWSGNVLFAAGGEPVLIDPAVYIGHREVDLAMCRLFGGFPASFYRAYSEAWPLQPSHRGRVSAYQVYLGLPRFHGLVNVGVDGV